MKLAAYLLLMLTAGMRVALPLGPPVSFHKVLLGAIAVCLLSDFYLG
jgi:hypothetical protein